MVNFKKLLNPPLTSELGGDDFDPSEQIKDPIDPSTVSVSTPNTAPLPPYAITTSPSSKAVVSEDLVRNTEPDHRTLLDSITNSLTLINCYCENLFSAIAKFCDQKDIQKEVNPFLNLLILEFETLQQETLATIAENKSSDFNGSTLYYQIVLNGEATLNKCFKIVRDFGFPELEPILEEFYTQNFLPMILDLTSLEDFESMVDEKSFSKYSQEFMQPMFSFIKNNIDDFVRQTLPSTLISVMTNSALNEMKESMMKALAHINSLFLPSEADISVNFFDVIATVRRKLIDFCSLGELHDFIAETKGIILQLQFLDEDLTLNFLDDPLIASLLKDFEAVLGDYEKHLTEFVGN